MSPGRDEEQNFHGAEPYHAKRSLRKLFQHMRSNIPAMMAQRSVSSFTLQQDTAPLEASSMVLMMVYPQNPFLGEPELRRMSAQDLRDGLLNDRVRIQDSRGVIAKPDEDGNYLYWPGTPEFDQVNAFYYTTFTLRMYERYARRVIPWSFPAPRINVDPYAGGLANAFYNEQDRLLGFHTFNEANGESRSTAQSADVVAHEAAHAVLDGMRDLYNESFGLGPRAFHESFGDITAVLVALHDDSLVHRVLDWTDGNLRMTNFISEVAEHITAVLNAHSQHIHEHSIFLRNAFNTLRLQDFDSLDYLTPDPERNLGRQEHNYSRVFTGAFYDALVGVYEQYRKDTPAFLALLRARDVLAHLLVTAIEIGPVGEFSFTDMALSFLTADQVLYGGRYQDVVTKAFAERGIISQEMAALHLEARAALPNLRLPGTINNAMDAALFLEDVVLPALQIEMNAEMVPLSTYRNAAHHAYMTFMYAHTIELTGPEFGEYSGAEIDLFGGLTLMFDQDDRLQSALYRPVLDEDIRQARIIIAELIEHDRISEDIYPAAVLPSPQPRALWVPTPLPDELDAGRIVKYPAVFDETWRVGQGLVDYLRARLEEIRRQ